jgi:hypothetical protein
MESIVAALVSFVLIEPLKADMADKLAIARAPQAIVAEVTACARTAAPLVIARATSDPWWATEKALSIWIGTTRPETLLIEVAPGCSGAVEAAQPFLAGNEA